MGRDVFGVTGAVGKQAGGIGSWVGVAGLRAQQLLRTAPTPRGSKMAVHRNGDYQLVGCRMVLMSLQPGEPGVNFQG